MNEDINEWKAALAERDARIERLEAELKRLHPPPVPAAVSYPDGHTAISTVKNRIILPTMDELHRLEEMVYRAYPKLKVFSSDAEEAASSIAAARESRRHRAAIAARPCRRGEPMMAYAAAVEPGGPRDRHQAIEFTVAIGVVRM
jgi:hypothetical protein